MDTSNYNGDKLRHTDGHSKILGIALTKRSNGAASSVALAGFPHHSLEQYLYKLEK